MIQMGESSVVAFECHWYGCCIPAPAICREEIGCQFCDYPPAKIPRPRFSATVAIHFDPGVDRKLMFHVRFNRGRAAVAAGVAMWLASAGSGQAAPGLKVTGMTFVGSRGELSELVVRAEQALFYPDTNRADLVRVRASVTDAEKGESFKMTCDKAELNVETNDFKAIGNVEGVTGDGQRYSAPWVHYEHEASMLYTDAPVVVEDRHGVFRGDGFRYFINERRFELLGNVSVEQNQ